MKLKDLASFFAVAFIEKPLYEVCSTRIKEQVDEKRSTAGTLRNADYQHFGIVSFFNIKICIILKTRYLCLRWPFFFMK